MTIPKVSVVIPVYNVSKYMSRCCDSLFNQTLEDMEFVFVNDGSKDDSILKVSKSIQKHPNRKGQVKIINRLENRGVSYTRQEGLDASTGAYVIHCDSDDWIDPNMYESLFKEAIKNDADVVCCGYYVEEHNKTVDKKYYQRTDFFSPLLFDVSPLTGSLCNKLVRRELISKNNIVFPKGINWGEDFCFAISVLISSHKTVCLSDCFYHYCQNEASITNTPSINKIKELTKVADVVEQFLQKKDKTSVCENQINYLKFQLKSCLLRSSEVRNIELWRSLFPECHKDIFSYPYSTYMKIAAKLAAYHVDFGSYLILKLHDIYQIMRR